MAIPSINSAIGKFINKGIESRWMAKRLDKSLRDPASFAAAMLVTSIVSKDAINCVVYTAQSLNNEKIPKEKRGFVASLDLMNGILNVVGQIIAFSIVDKKVIPMLFGKHYSGTLKDKITNKETPLPGIDATRKSRLVSDNLLETVKDIAKKGNHKNINVEKVTNALIKDIGKGSKNFMAYESGFSLLVGALATTALVKRTLTPLIATPLAGWFKDNYLEKNNKKNEKKPEIKQADMMEIKSATVAAPWPYARTDNKNGLTQDQFTKTATK